jgi:hypothetical protein
MKAIVKIDVDETGVNDLIIVATVYGPEVEAVFGGSPASTTIYFDYQEAETLAQRKSRAIALLNEWRLSMGLPVPTKVMYLSSLS